MPRGRGKRTKPETIDAAITDRSYNRRRRGHHLSAAINSAACIRVRAYVPHARADENQTHLRVSTHVHRRECTTRGERAYCARGYHVVAINRA